MGHVVESESRPRKLVRRARVVDVAAVLSFGSRTYHENSNECGAENSGVLSSTDRGLTLHHPSLLRTADNRELDNGYDRRLTIFT